MIIRELTVQEYEGVLSQLAKLLVDAVDSNAGVSFVAPLDQDTAVSFWRTQVGEVSKGATIHFVAEQNGELLGTVLLNRAWQPNQPHRAELAKMMVKSSYRRRGIGRLLLEAAEAKAVELGVTLMTFDAVAHSRAENFYREAGYQVAGYYPNYALSPRGQLEDTALLYKQL